MIIVSYQLRQGLDSDRLACFELLQRNMKPYFKMHGLSYKSDAFARIWQEGSPWVLTWGERLAGFMLWLPLETYAFLPTIQVAPRHRMRGVGTQLMQHFECEAWHKGYREVRLAVHADNPARRWYHQLGYELQGEEFVQIEYIKHLEAPPSPTLFAGSPPDH